MKIFCATRLTACVIFDVMMVPINNFHYQYKASEIKLLWQNYLSTATVDAKQLVNTKFGIKQKQKEIHGVKKCITAA